jgi:hypothetical protein
MSAGRRVPLTVVGESGMAMITTLLVMMVVVGLSVIMVANADHTSFVSARGRSWGQVVHVAESGVHAAVAELQANSGTISAQDGTGVAGTTAEGSYTYWIRALSPSLPFTNSFGVQSGYLVDAVGKVGSGGGSLGATRRLRVLIAPPLSFQYALFSLSDVTTKNNNVVCGDIWANGSVTVYQNDSVLAATNPTCSGNSNASGSGSVNAAGGSVTIQGGGAVDGSIWSGGTGGVTISSGTVGGNVTAGDATPTCSDVAPGGSSYSVSNGGTISGNVTAWGSITGSGTISGTRNPATCAAAPVAIAMPTYQFNPNAYPAGTVQQFSDPSAFNTYAAGQATLSGVFYITGGGATNPVTLSNVQISGDTTIIATQAPIDGTGGIGAANNNPKTLVLASWYQTNPTNCATNGGNPGDCAVGFKNNFQPSNNTSTLIYAPNGPVAFKNNANFTGAVYAANIQVKNNMNITYDSRLQRVIGFGNVTYQIMRWLECNPNLTGTSAQC